MSDETEKKKRYDLDGYQVVTDALQDLLNSYPALQSGESIRFSTLAEDSGITFYPVSGAIIDTETTSVTGKVNQLCNYPFYIQYRTSADSQESKINIKDFLDQIGKWLEKQPVTINEKKYQLEEYPQLTAGHEITGIERETPAYLESAEANGVQDWIISLTLKYRNIYYKKEQKNG